MADLSHSVDDGDTSGRLLLRVTVERDHLKALLVIKVVDDSETIAADWVGRMEDCKFRVPRLNGGNKGQGDSNKGEPGNLEDPEGKEDALIGGY